MFSGLRSNPVPRTRRVFLLAALIAAIAVISAACGGDSNPTRLDGLAAEVYDGECAAKTGDEVVVYSGRSEALVKPVLDAFACETGTPIAVRYAPSVDLARLIDTEGESTPADVFISRSPGPVGFLESKDLLGQISDDVLNLVSEENRGSNGTWVGFSGRKRVMVHNIDNMGADELPESVFELTDPLYEGRVALPATNGSFVDWFTVFRDVHGTDVATQWLDDMVANDATYYPNNRSIVEAAGRGEIDSGLVNHYYNYQEQIANGDSHRAENHDFAPDDIGSLLIISAATVTSSTENQAGAEALLAYLLSESAQTYFTNETFEYPLAAGVEPRPELPPLEALEIGTVDYDKLGSGFEETTEIIAASGILNQ